MSAVAQERLFVLPFDESKLGRNQRAVLARIDRYGWVSAREAGRIVYRQRGLRNPDGVPKPWLLSAGLDVLKSLQNRRLVKRRWRRDGKTSVWIRDTSKRSRVSALGPALTTQRLAWHNKGFADARYHQVKNPPEDPKAREAYLQAWRVGNRERLRAEAEGRP